MVFGRRVKPDRTGIRAPLGELEREVMAVLWARGLAMASSQVHAALSRRRPIALTTVITTLERLNEKEIVERERRGRGYHYSAVLSKEQLEERIVGHVLDDLIKRFPTAVTTYFVGRAAEPARHAARPIDARPKGKRTK